MTKYVDHGLYGACAFTASRSTTTLTVTAVSAGRIGLGTIFKTAGADIADDTYYVSAYVGGGGTGGAEGTGNYTLAPVNGAATTGTTVSQAMTGKLSAIALAPAWGVAQEGDGTASTAATAATVSIALSAATAAAGATFSIMGAVLTCVTSGAATNQFNAGTGATLVANLVAAINRTTNTSILVAQAAGWATPKIQDAVFARINGVTTTLDIMTRAGSAQYNTSTVTTAGFTGGTFGPYTFSGGAGGAWGALNNTLSTTLPSAVAANAYGVWGSASVMAGVQAAGDRINVRAGNKLLWCIGNGYPAIGPPATIGSSAAPVEYVVDDGTVWPADAPNPLLEIRHIGTITNQFTSVNFNGASGFTALTAKRYSSGASNLLVTEAGVSSCGAFLNVGTSAVRDVDVVSSGVNGFARLQIYSAVANRQSKVTGVKLYAPLSTSWMLGYSGNGYTADINGCEFNNTGASLPHTGVIAMHSTQPCDIHLQGCKFPGFIAGSALWSGSTYGSACATLVDCNFGNVTVRGPFVSLQTTNNAFDLARVVSIGSRYANRDHSIDTVHGFVEWNSLLGFPTFSALLRDGVTPWSWRVKPSTLSGVVSLASPAVTPWIVTVNSAPVAGVGTFTIQFCANDAISPALTTDDVSCVIMYDDVNGNIVVLDSLDLSSAALTASSDHWSSENGGGTQVQFIDAGTLLFNRYKITMSTPAGKNIAAGTEVRARLNFYRQMATSTQYFFVDPSVGIVVV